MAMPSSLPTRIPPKAQLMTTIPTAPQTRNLVTLRTTSVKMIAKWVQITMQRITSMVAMTMRGVIMVVEEAMEEIMIELLKSRDEKRNTTVRRFALAIGGIVTCPMFRC